ncbi:MAG: diaminopimelate epimerase [Verrucomicrobiales bacterium]|nr:diaminopimelate epimerase [Verrucomicrobiales bacterium]
MTLEFTKMSGAGNDFILADNRSGEIRLTREQVARLCHRQFGIGADGLMLLVPARSEDADWAWTFFNSDGSDAEMCGNGARCFARFAQRITGAEGGLSIETAAGIIRARFDGPRVTVNLTAPHGLHLGRAVTTGKGDLQVHSLNTGVPHAVVLVPDADQAMVGDLGRELRFHPAFQPAGTNVNFVQVLGPGSIRVRTYERGVESETLACGTGVTASALVCARLQGWPSPVEVRVQGGDILKVGFEERAGAFANVQLTGPAEFVFTGSIDI